MAFTPDTQQGATFTVGGVSWEIDIQEIPSITETIPTIDTTSLATTGSRTYIAGDLKDTDEFEIMAYHDGSTTLPTIGTQYTVTKTHPTASGDSTPESYAGTAICTNIASPAFSGGANALQEIRMSFKLDGGENSGTAWTRTPAS